jgi:hypothetical protein
MVVETRRLTAKGNDDDEEEFSRLISEKIVNIKFNQNPSSGSRVVLCGGTDGHDEVNSLSSQFC